MATYIYELDDWPNFRWSGERLSDLLARVRHRQGRLVGRMEGLGFKLREAATLGSRTEEVMKSSEIEGENLDRNQVRSSVARRLGIDIGASAPRDRHIDGVVEMMLDATENFASPLGRVDIHLRARTDPARYIIAAKLSSVLSYRVATRRYCLMLQKKFSTR
jgi:Fic family protein